ncbi:MAG: response regulator transcription factor [Cellulosilyticaceae bacterium]
MAQTILVVEDEEGIRRVIRDYLTTHGFDVIEAQNGKEAMTHIEKGGFDLAIFDVMLPYVDGWTLCRRLRQQSAIPVLFLTARGEEYDELMGFEVGADDYIKKPFSPAVLVVRVKKLLGKQDASEQADTKLIKDVLEIDVEALKVQVDGQAIELTHKEFQILAYLAKNEGRALSREMILIEVWGYDYIGDDRVVDNHIKKIRKALGEYAYMIRTVFGVGYIFEV